MMKRIYTVLFYNFDARCSQLRIEKLGWSCFWTPTFLVMGKEPSDASLAGSSTSSRNCVDREECQYIYGLVKSVGGVFSHSTLKLDDPPKPNHTLFVTRQQSMASVDPVGAVDDPVRSLSVLLTVSLMSTTDLPR